MTLMRKRDERGFVLPTRLLALCISAVAVAALVFVANDPDQAPTDRTATPAVSKPSSTPTATADRGGRADRRRRSKPKPKPVKRGEVFVVVFNNTRTAGLAGGVAEKAKSPAGTSSARTTGTAPSTAPRSTSLRVSRRPPRRWATTSGSSALRPAEEPMQFDRLTVILTDDYL